MSLSIGADPTPGTATFSLESGSRIGFSNHTSVPQEPGAGANASHVGLNLDGT